MVPRQATILGGSQSPFPFSPVKVKLLAGELRTAQCGIVSPSSFSSWFPYRRVFLVSDKTREMESLGALNAFWLDSGCL